MSETIQATIELVQGDITQQAVQAIVNAANSSLLGGGGVDGAIHRAAGKALLAECRSLDGCPTGEARLTKGYDLPADYVIHTVGPVYAQYSPTQAAQLLRSAHRNSLTLAHEQGLKSIAFPAISTGVYGYPIAEAAQVALSATIDHLKKHQSPLELVRFVLFSDRAFCIFSETLAEFNQAD